MKPRPRSVCSLTLFLMLLISSGTSPSQTKTSFVHGTVFLETPSGRSPLTLATVILAPGPVRSGNRTYTNSDGVFAFYGIKPGKYDLLVTLDEIVMKQRLADKVVERRRVDVRADGDTRVDDI